MRPLTADLVARIPDEGQWFERGTRVDFFKAGRSGRKRLGAAALRSLDRNAIVRVGGLLVKPVMVSRFKSTMLRVGEQHSRPIES